MSFSARAKRVLVGAMAGAMVLSLMPAGIASAGVDEVCENAMSPFTDKGTTHADAIDCIYSYDITTGRTATTFGTFENLTRGQAATLFVNFAVVATDGAIADEIDADIDVPFTDIDGTTHEANIEILYRLGLIQGTTVTTYSPNDQILRAQFAEILFGAHEALGVDFEDTYPNPFTDVDRFAVSALTGEGIFSGTDEAGIFDPWSPVLRGQTASTLALSAGLLDDLGLWLAPRLQPEGPALSLSDAPDLVNVAITDDATNRLQVEFTFDADVRTDSLEEQNFYVLGWNGAQIQADQVLRQDQAVTGGSLQIVRASFVKTLVGGNYFVGALHPTSGLGNGVGAEQLELSVPRVDDLIGAGVSRAAVQDLDNPVLVNSDRALPLPGVTVPGDFMFSPTIVDVSAPNTVSDWIDVEFSYPVTVNDASGFLLYINENEVLTGQDSNVTGSTVRVFFDDDNEQDLTPGTSVNRIVALPGTVSWTPTAGAFAGADVENTLTSLQVGPNTDGPDLVGYELDYDNDRVKFTFDQPITTDDLDPAVAPFRNGFDVRGGLHHPWIVSAFTPDELNDGDGEVAVRPDAGFFQVHYADSSNNAEGNTQGVASGDTFVNVVDQSLAVVVQFDEGAITKDITRVGVGLALEFGGVGDPNDPDDVNATRLVLADDTPNAGVVGTAGNRIPNTVSTLGVDHTFDSLETLGPDLLEVNVTADRNPLIDNRVENYSIEFVFSSAIEEGAGGDVFYVFTEDGGFQDIPFNAARLSADRMSITYTAARAGGGDFSFNVARDAVAAGVSYDGVQNFDVTNPIPAAVAATNLDDTQFFNYGQTIFVTFPQ